MSNEPAPAQALEQLKQNYELKIISITEPLKPKEISQSSKKRNSAASVDSDPHVDTHPAALEADLKHYKVRIDRSRGMRKSNNSNRSYSVSFASLM